MDTPLAVTRPHVRMLRPTLRLITVGALLVNALVFVYDMLESGPDGLNLGHVIPTLLIAGIVAWRKRWTPAVGAFICFALLLEGYIFIGETLIQPPTAADFAFTAVFLGSALVGLIAGVGATVQNYRAVRSRPFADPRWPAWTSPALFAFVGLVLGAILTTAVQARGVLPGVSPETLAALPPLQAKDYLFAQPEIRAKVGETVVLRLDNADSSTHYLDIDEFNVHAPMPSGKSNVAIFKPTQPGTYTFYCAPHSNKATGEGMVGKLIVAP